MMSVGLHCRIVGRPGRAPALDRFLAHVKQREDVWVTTRAEIARHWRDPPPAGARWLTRSGSPPLHEEEVGGVAASVFQDIRARMPFVPALFKALADDPEALLSAWLQARALYDDPDTAAPAERLRRRARPRASRSPRRPSSAPPCGRSSRSCRSCS